MKRLFLILRPIALIGIGLLFAITGAVLAGQPASSAAGLTAGAFAAAATPTPPPVSEVGSTDWITLTSILIVLIVITPILVRRKYWNH